MRGSLPILLATFVTAALAIGSAQNQPTPASQFEQAVTLMDVKADYRSAARLFQTIADGSDRALAARALVYLGRCYEQLGDAKAREVYRRLIDTFADQAAAVADARARLAELERRSASSSGAARTLRPLWERGSARGTTVGRPSYDGRFVPIMDAVPSLMLYDLATRRVGPAIPISEGDATLPACRAVTPPALSPDASQVVFSCAPDSGGPFELRLARTDPARTAVSRLLSTAAGEFVEVLDWSSPNTLLAQVRAADGAVRLVTLAVTGVTRQIARLAAPAGTASSSPDGRWVVFDGPGDPVSKDRDVFIASNNGGEARPLIGGTFNDTSPLWAPDGRGIVFVSERTGSPGLWYQAVAGGRAEGAARLLFPDLGRIATVMGLTRSGKFVYYRETGLVDVHVVDLGPDGLPSGPPANASTNRIGQNLMPAWSPDGAQLAYVSRERGIVIRNAVSGSERVLGSGLTGVGQPRWSPTGRSILVRAWDQLSRYGFFTLDAATGQVTTLKTVAATDEAPLNIARWTRDGRAILYLFGNDVRRLHVEDGRDELIHTIPKERSVLSFLDVRAADDAIVLVLGERGSAGTSLNVIDPDGTLRRVLDSNGPERLGQPIWLPDGRGIVFSRMRTDPGLAPEARRPTLWRMDLGTRAVRALELPVDGPRDPAVSPDGRRMAFTAGYPTREPWILEHVLPGRPGTGRGEK